MVPVTRLNKVDDDVITGSFQSETIAGGTGNDTLSGVNGSDTFVFAIGDGVDHITDYYAANETLEFTGISFADLTITQVGSDVLIEYGTSDQVILDNSVIANFAEPSSCLRNTRPVREKGVGKIKYCPTYI